MRRARWKRKNVRRVGLRRRRPPAAGGGWLAVPCGGQGRKRPALGETSSPGQSGIPSATLPAAAHASSKNSQRQRKEKQLNASTTPTQEHHPPRDGSRGNRRRPKRARRSAQIGACTDTPTPVARGGPLHRSAPTLFSLDRARPVSLLARPNMGPSPRPARWGEEEQGSGRSFRRRRKRSLADFATTTMGGASWLDKPPCGSRHHRGRRSAAPPRLCSSPTTALIRQVHI